MPIEIFTMNPLTALKVPTPGKLLLVNQTLKAKQFSKVTLLFDIPGSREKNKLAPD